MYLVREKVSFEVKNFLTDKNNRLFAVALAIVLLAGLAYMGYKYHYRGVQRAAQKDFAQAMQTYNEAVTGQAKKENIWNEVEFAFKTGYEQNKSSSFAPFFLAYQSEALLKLNNKEEAYKVLTQAIDSMKSKSPFSYFYQVKQALMQIDMNQEENGVKHLQNLANDTNNQFTDLANYYLGEYYWSKNDISNAQKHFELVSKPSLENKDQKTESPWVHYAQEKLEQLS